MGAEAQPTGPEKRSNVGKSREMVAEVVAVGQKEEFLSEMALRSKSGARKLLVGLKLTTSCREMLTWTIAKLAQPGDHISAVHVSSLPLHSGTTPKEQEYHAQQLANTLRGALSVYEGLCNLKQIKLQVEIITGCKVKKSLVEVARSHEACKLILGSNKHFTLGRATALGRYCLKRLPSTCTVVILEHGEIIFDRTGRLGEGMTRSGMLKALGKSMRSVGRSKKVGSGESEESDDQARSSISFQLAFSGIPHDLQSNGCIDYSSELDLNLESGSSFPHEGLSTSFTSILSSEKRNSTSGFEALRMSFSKWRAQEALKSVSSGNVSSPGVEVERADMFLLQDQTPAEPKFSAETNLLDLSTSTHLGSSATHQGPEAARVSEDVFVPGWPLLHHTIGVENKIPVPSLVDRDLSVVKWALQLPDRAHDPSFSLRKITKDHWRRTPSQKTACWKKEGEGDGGSLAERVDSLLLDRPCNVFTLQELEAATSNFSPSNVVGQGGGSEVFRGEMHDGKVVAVKRLNHGPQAEGELLNDIEINTSLSHVHIVSLLGFCVDSSNMILVYEYLPEGNLEDHLHGGEDSSILSWDVRYKVAVGIAKALDYLHDGCPHPVVHRDVKASNILLSSNFESQLSDFGLAKWAPEKASHIRCNDVVGTFGYLAPEYFMYGKVNEKTDVYAFGVVLLELITGRKPIDTSRPKGQENLVIWARSVLEEKNLDKLVDPQLKGVYDVDQMSTMLQAASLCVKQSALRRPRMSLILRLLFSDYGESQSIWAQLEETMEMDFEEFDGSIEGTSPNYDKSETDIQTHLALAMLGVDDDVTSQCSVEHIQHSSKYLEEYLEGRFSRSASFEG